MKKITYKKSIITFLISILIIANSYSQPSSQPVFTSTPIITINEGEEYKYFVTTTDPDLDIVNISAITKPNWLNLSSIDLNVLETLAQNLSSNNNGVVDIVVDSSGNIYFSDLSDNNIKKIDISGNITVFAGSGSFGSQDGQGTNASFNLPLGLDIDASGNIFVADFNSHKIRKIDPTGNVTTVTHNGSFNYPEDVAVDNNGNIYGYDGTNVNLFKITPTGIYSNELSPNFSSGYSLGNLDIDSAGNVFFINSSSIMKLDTNGTLSVFAGNSSEQGHIDENGIDARFSSLRDISVDNNENIFVTEGNSNLIRKITPSGEVSTVVACIIGSTADDIIAPVTNFFGDGIFADNLGNIYFSNSDFVKKINSGNQNTVITLEGDSTGQVGIYPIDLEATDGNGGITNQNFNVEVITTPTLVSNAATNVSINDVTLNGDVTLDGRRTITQRGFVYSIKDDNPDPILGGANVSSVIVSGTLGIFSESVVGLQANSTYTFKAFATNAVGTSYGTVLEFTTLNTLPVFTSTAVTSVIEGDAYVYNITTNDDDLDVVSVTASTLPSWLTLNFVSDGEVTTLAGSGVAGFSDATGISAQFNKPRGVAVDDDGNIFVADNNNNRIRKIIPTGEVTTFAGSGAVGSADGMGVNASFWFPQDVAVDNLGNVYVADSQNHKIRKITPSGDVTTLAGGFGDVDGTGLNAKFNYPTGIEVDDIGNIYVADSKNHKIRKINSTLEVTTFAGSGSAGSVDATGTNSSFKKPRGLALDNDGNVYVADHENHKIRKITPSGDVTTYAGSGVGGYANGSHDVAKFNFPTGVVVDNLGNVYVADQFNHRVRKINQDQTVSTLAGSGNLTFNDGLGEVASFHYPEKLALDSSGDLLVADYFNERIRKVTLQKIELIGDSSGQAGDHIVVLEVDDGNGGITFQNFTINVSGSTAGTSDFNLNEDFYVYPNPVSNILKISNKKNIEIKDIYLYDIVGKVMKIENSNDSINLNQISNGVYMIKIITEKGTGTLKIIKK